MKMLYCIVAGRNIKVRFDELFDNYFEIKELGFSHSITKLGIPHYHVYVMCEESVEINDLINMILENMSISGNHLDLKIFEDTTCPEEDLYDHVMHESDQLTIYKRK